MFLKNLGRERLKLGRQTDVSNVYISTKMRKMIKVVKNGWWFSSVTSMISFPDAQLVHMSGFECGGQRLMPCIFLNRSLIYLERFTHWNPKLAYIVNLASLIQRCPVSSSKALGWRWTWHLYEFWGGEP